MSNLEFLKVWYFDKQIQNKYDDVYDDIPKNTTFSLDMNKKAFSPIEKYIHDIASFHMNRIGANHSDCFVSFSIKENYFPNVNVLGHIPSIMSGFFYLQDSNFPQIFTDMDLESYKFKEFDDKNMLISFPKKFKNFTWEDGTGNDSSKLLEENTSNSITIEICEANISKLTRKYMLVTDEGSESILTVFFEIHSTKQDHPFFDGKYAKFLYKNEKEIVSLSSGCISNWVNNDKTNMDPYLCSFVCPNRKIMRINHKEPDLEGSEDNSYITGKKYQPINKYNEFTRDFMDELVYYPKQSTYEVFNELLIDYPKYDLFLLPNLFQHATPELIKLTVSEAAPITRNIADLKQPKFSQRFKFENFYTPDSCEWVINECEIIAKQRNGWKQSGFWHYPSHMMDLDTNDSVFRYIITQFKTILDKIIQSYSLHKDTNVDITNVFILKYNSDTQYCIEPGKDDSSITIQIMLSDIEKFVGGGIQFDDRLIQEISGQTLFFVPNQISNNIPENDVGVCRNITKLKQGDMLIYNGDCRHSELPITNGTKYSIIIFSKVHIPETIIEEVIVVPDTKLVPVVHGPSKKSTLTYKTHAQFTKVIIWGYPLHSHTHSFVHYGWVKGFKYLNYETFWFHDEEYPTDFDYNNCLFITEGYADKNIPIVHTSTYFVHYAIDPMKYYNKVKRLIDMRFLMDSVNNYAYNYTLNKDECLKISNCTYYEKLRNNQGITKYHLNPTEMDYECIYTCWATDLLPHEIKYENMFHERENKIYWYATANHTDTEEIKRFYEECQKNNIEWIENNSRKTLVSSEIVQENIMKSYMSPDIRSDSKNEISRYDFLHKTNGYIPCRLFKNISYGQLGITNSKHAYELLEESVIYNSDESQLFYDALTEMKNYELIKKQMDIVRKKHTFINRINDVISILDM
jgi:hypothetical protein